MNDRLALAPSTLGRSGANTLCTVPLSTKPRPIFKFLGAQRRLEHTPHGSIVGAEEAHRCPRLGDLAFEKRPSLVCELKHPAAVVEGDVLVGNETLHELRERLMPSLIKDEAMGMEIPHGDRAALLRYELQQALSGRLDVRAHFAAVLLS